ncbi:MAG: Hsp70 family protein [Phycisphaerae bacterium]|nr:Hsp70 family protein [Phycisphaerae bacterium]
MDSIIKRNSPIPIVPSRFKTYPIASVGQIPGRVTVKIPILQGDKKYARDNKILGQLELEDILYMPPVKNEISISFEVDVNGILKVRARELNTGKEVWKEVKCTYKRTEKAKNWGRGKKR